MVKVGKYHKNIANKLNEASNEHEDLSNEIATFSSFIYLSFLT